MVRTQRAARLRRLAPLTPPPRARARNCVRDTAAVPPPYQAHRQAATYESKVGEESDSFGKLAAKLTADLRNHIRMMNSFPVMSPAWVKMTDDLERVSAVAEMERQLPKDDKDATLWECEEQALRFILEDGKLNLCLRNLVDYKTFEREALGEGKRLKRSVRSTMDRFETSLGLTLKNAWRHVEALQTTDLPLLLSHVADVLAGCPAHLRGLAACAPASGGGGGEGGGADGEGKEGDGEEEEGGGGGGGAAAVAAAAGAAPFGARQEAMVLHYLHGLCKRLDEIDEGRVMPFILERRLLHLLACHLHAFQAQLGEEDLWAGAEALSILFDTEDFDVNGDEYLEDDGTKRALVGIGAGFVAAKAAEDVDQRRALRPLLDGIEMAERALRGK